MSTGYGWKGLRQVCATLLGARHVPECLCGGTVYTCMGAIQVFDLLHGFKITPTITVTVTARNKHRVLSNRQIADRQHW